MVSNKERLQKLIRSYLTDLAKTLHQLVNQATDAELQI